MRTRMYIGSPPPEAMPNLVSHLLNKFTN